MIDSNHSERVNILGVGVDPINLSCATDTLITWVEQKTPGYVCVTGVHGIIESQRDENLRRIHHSAAMVTPDGMPLVWLSKLYGYRKVSRVYGPDLMLSICNKSVSLGFRHYFYGGGQGVPEKLGTKLVEKFPGIKIVGCFSPPYRPLTSDEDRAIIDRINKTSPDIIWVGISTPKQEQWMVEHVDQLKGAILIGVGAAFDFIAGTKRQAPRWMQSIGMEWFFRLLSEPRRLWKRYLINNPLFIILVLGQAFHLKKYNLD